MKRKEGWNSCLLGELLVSKNNKVKQVKSTECASVGSFPVVDQSKDYICGYHEDKAKLIDTDLPLTVFGDHTRHTKFIEFPFIAGADGTQLLKPRRGIEDKFFYYLVAYASEKIGNYGYDRHFKHLKEYVCDYPLRKADQTKIAEILSTVDRAIEQTEALISKQQRIKTGLVQDLLMRGIDEHGNLRSEQTHQFKDSLLGRIPVEWEVKPLAELSTQITNGFVGVATPYYSDSFEGVPYLYGNNVRANELELAQPLYVQRSFHNRQKKSQLQPGNMLTVQSGHIGTTTIVPENLGEANCHALIITKFRKDILEPQFIGFYCNSHVGMSRMSYLFIGSTIKHINTSEFARFIIPFPPKAEQQRISEKIEEVLSVIVSAKAGRQKLHSLKTALKQDLLTGKKPVTPLLNHKEVMSG